MEFCYGKGIEEQCIIPSQLGSPKTKGFTVGGVHCKTGCR